MASQPYMSLNKLWSVKEKFKAYAIAVYICRIDDEIAQLFDWKQHSIFSINDDLRNAISSATGTIIYTSVIALRSNICVLLVLAGEAISYSIISDQYKILLTLPSSLASQLD